MVLNVYNCSLEGTDICIKRQSGNEELEISFRRTIRVPDTKYDSALPPDLGRFPLYKVKEYSSELPKSMVAKGGLFMPMYQREAMWINFKANSEFAIKILVGGVNVVSGEPAKETYATELRRMERKAQGKSVQDYVVVPKQYWLDGIASHDGVVRQFVAMPMGDGYSVEAQITGQEATGGIQFEITPSVPPLTEVPPVPLASGEMKVFANLLTGKTILLEVTPSHLVLHLKMLIENKEGIPPDQQRLVSNGRQLEDRLSLKDYEIKNSSDFEEVAMHVRPRWQWLLEAASLNPSLRTPYHVSKWKKESTIVFNVQVLNAVCFESITGQAAPETPITAKTYTKLGYPFFKMYEESSGISGKFSTVKSVAELDGEEETHYTPTVKIIGAGKSAKDKNGIANLDGGDGSSDSDSLLNPNGPSSLFRHISEINAELAKVNFATF